LLGCEQFNETTAEIVETVSLSDMLVQRNAEELRNNVNTIDATMEAVADRDVNQSVFGSQRNGRFSTDLGEWEKSGATTTTEN